MKTPALNRLFARWKRSYPKQVRSGFHDDGIIDEDRYLVQRKRVLFVLMEPNSTDGRFSHFYGKDLREVFRNRHPKQLTRNLGLWISAILDRGAKFRSINSDDAMFELRRVAVMNLKKLSGSSRPDYSKIGVLAWHDRKFIREQIKIMAPHIIFTCGKGIHNLFCAILMDDPFWNGDLPCWKGTKIFNIQHPATRGKHTKAAYRHVLQIMKVYSAKKAAQPSRTRRGRHSN